MQKANLNILAFIMLAILSTKTQTKNVYSVGGGFVFNIPNIYYKGVLNSSYLSAYNNFMFNYEKLYATYINLSKIVDSSFQLVLTTPIKLKVLLKHKFSGSILITSLYGSRSEGKASNNYDNFNYKTFV